jgi:cysteine-rich repeat protein
MKTGLAAILFIAACTSSSGNNGVCGDGTVDDGEQCDDGNTTSGDGCSATCTIETVQPVCGNGHVETGEECDDGNTANGDGCTSACKAEFKTTANWSFKLVDGTPQTCPPGYDTAALYSQLVDSTGAAVGQPVIDLFTCSDGTGTSGYLAPGVYDTWIAITTQDGTSTYEQSVDAIVDLTTGNKTYSADLYDNGGYFGWSWALQKSSNNQPLTCAQVNGIAGVELVVTVTNGTQGTTDMFSCEDGHGVTGVFRAGSYTVSADAFDGSNASIGTAPTLTNKLIQGPNKVTDLGTITIPITNQ